MLLAIIATLLFGIAIAPFLQGSYDERGKAEDGHYEDAAKRIILVEYNTSEHVFMAFDGYGKKLVKPKDAGTLTPYGYTKEHEGKVILLEKSGGEVTVLWLTPKEITENYSRGVNGN